MKKAKSVKKHQNSRKGVTSMANKRKRMYPTIGFKAGRIVHFVKGHGCDRKPTLVKVVGEYETHVVFRFYFRVGNKMNAYNKSFHKSSFYNGEVVVK